MGQGTKIEWATHTFNPWIGCQKVSRGCTNCYASVNTFTRAQRGRGRELWGPTAARHVVSEAKWREPEAWDRDAAAVGEKARVFCASMADVFEDRADLEAPRQRLFELILRTPHLEWLILTKRPENIGRLGDAEVLGRSWVGVSVEDQEHADQRVPLLLQTPAAVRFVSYEPALAPVDFTEWLYPKGDEEWNCLRWVIVGGESGPNARPFDQAWARSTVQQCRAAGVKVFVKQMGRWITGDEEGFALHSWLLSDGVHECGWVPPIIGPAALERPKNAIAFTLGGKGGDPSYWPEDLNVREFPA